MKYLSEKIMAYAEERPEGTPLTAKGLLHLGSRTAIDKALRLLTERGKLARIGRGLYMRKINGSYGIRGPSVGLGIDALAAYRNEVILPCGAAAANFLGLTTQNPIRYIYLTSGRSENLYFGKQHVELRHAPSWQLALGNSPSGQAVRALAFFGPLYAEDKLKLLKRKLSDESFAELVAAAPKFPDWLANTVRRVAHG